MAEDLTDQKAFEPLGDARGVSLTANGSTSTSSRVPGAQGEANPVRLRIVNKGTQYCYLALGGSTITATTNHMCIAPGVVEMFTAPSANPSGLYAAVIADSGGTTQIQITAGKGY